MESLSDHGSRRSTGGRRPDRGSSGAIAALNRVLLLTGALLFINGVSVTLIAALIPFAISSAIVISTVTVVTAMAAIAYAVKRKPARMRTFVEAARPLVESVTDRDRERPRRQGGL